MCNSLSVGTGAFSKVYLGSNIAKSAKVAIKVIDRSTLFDEEEKRLAAEIEILHELSHANIISESIQYDFFLSIVVIFIYGWELNLNKFPSFTSFFFFVPSEFTLTAIHDAYCEAESYRIILEYMNGGDLLGIIEKENSLDERNARDICYSIVSAITHLHTHSIAHR